jgi:AAA15 family ATPase/GTPase
MRILSPYNEIMLITKFSVKNFKLFQEECVFDFSRIRDYSFHKEFIKNGIVNKALVYGYNGSGKSSIGFALMDINNHLTDKTKSPFYYQNFLNANSIDKLASFSYTFLDDSGRDIVYSYTKDAGAALHNETIYVNKALMFEYNYETDRVINNFPETSQIVFGNRTKNLSAVKFMRNNTQNLPKDSPVEEIVDFAENMLWFRSVRENEYMGKLDNGELLTDYIIGNNLVPDFQQFLHDCGLDYSLDVMVVPGGKVLVIKFAQRELEFFSTVSTGTLSLVLFYYWTRRCQKQLKFLFLDEFDAFYHDKLSKLILSKINQDSSFQSVLTTHNSYLADNTLMRPDCYFIMKNGKITSFADSTNKVIREGNSLENMYLSGAFE